jgi:hypothetical protein
MMHMQYNRDARLMSLYASFSMHFIDRSWGRATLATLGRSGSDVSQTTTTMSHQKHVAGCQKLHLRKSGAVRASSVASTRALITAEPGGVYSTESKTDTGCISTWWTRTACTACPKTTTLARPSSLSRIAWRACRATIKSTPVGRTLSDPKKVRSLAPCECGAFSS